MSEEFVAFRSKDDRKLNNQLEDLAYRVIGAAIEVHNKLGIGLPEIAYRRALSHELTLRNIVHQSECAVPILYKGLAVAEGRVDILVENVLVIEIKVVEKLSVVHRAQVIAYLCALNLELGLLLNFNHETMREGTKRVIRTQ